MWTSKWKSTFGAWQKVPGTAIYFFVSVLSFFFRCRRICSQDNENTRKVVLNHDVCCFYNMFLQSCPKFKLRLITVFGNENQFVSCLHSSRGKSYPFRSPIVVSGETRQQYFFAYSITRMISEYNDWYAWAMAKWHGLNKRQEQGEGAGWGQRVIKKN